MHIISKDWDWYDTSLCQLNCGDAFEFNGNIYMFVRACGLVPKCEEGENFACVNITDGSLHILKGSDKVHQVTAEVKIGEYK